MIESFIRGCCKKQRKQDEEKGQENEYSIGKYLHLFSAYNYRDKKIWIVTEADRSATTILFPEEY